MVNKNGEPFERFLKFIPRIGHTAAAMETAVIDTFSKFKINIADCRGHSYDNAANMSGVYSGLQARIKSHNPLAQYVPCPPHSLNLVGQSAADCCTNATLFFIFVNNIYTFFTASTSRYKILRQEKTESENDETLIPKSLSKTRWSAKRDANLCIGQILQSFLQRPGKNIKRS